LAVPVGNAHPILDMKKVDHQSEASSVETRIVSSGRNDGTQCLRAYARSLGDV
jgi:hypothetical protein